MTLIKYLEKLCGSMRGADLKSQVNQGLLSSVCNVLYVLFLAKTSYMLLNYSSVDVHDEVGYLMKGIHLDLLSFIDYFTYKNDWSPLYVLWYKALSYMTKDPLVLYQLNKFIILFTLSTLVFVLLTRSSVGFIFSALISVVILLNPHTSMTTRLPNHFALLWIISLAVLITRKIKPEKKIVCMFMILGSASYIRPEYVLSSFIACILLIYYCRNSFKKDYKTVVMCVVIFLSIFTHFKIREPGKAVDTFYAKNQERLEHLHDRRVSKEEVANSYLFSKSLTTACLSNVYLCGSHIFFNIKTYAKHLIYGLMNTIISAAKISYIPLFALAIAALLVSIKKREWRELFFIKRIKANAPVERNAIIFSLIMFTPTFSICLLFGPLFQYEVGHLVIFFFLICCFLLSFKINYIISRKYLLLFFGVLLLIPLDYPMSAFYRGLPFDQIDYDKRIISILKKIRNIDITSDYKVKLLTDAGRLIEFSPRPVIEKTLEWEKIYSIENNFSSVLKKNEINVIAKVCEWNCNNEFDIGLERYIKENENYKKIQDQPIYIDTKIIKEEI